MTSARNLVAAAARGAVVALLVVGLSACTLMGNARVIAGEAAVPDVAPTPTAQAEVQRTGDFSFGHPVRQEVPSASAPFEATMRVPFELGVDATEFRVHVRNRQFDTEQVFGSAVSITGAWVGEQQGSGSGFAAAPTEVAGGAAVPADGFVSDWISPGDLALTAHTGYLLSLGIEAEAGATLATTYGLSWLDTSAGASGRVAASGAVGEQVAHSYLDVWIEYRFEGDAPVLVSIGHSLNAPANFAQTRFPIQGEVTAWPQQWALANDAVAVTLAAPGSQTPVFGPAASKWEEFDGLDPDVVTIWAASNDLADGRAVADIQSDWLAIVATVKRMWPNALVVAMTEPPRGLGQPEEQNRLDWNAWLKRMPPGVDRVIDTDAVLRDPLQPSRLRVDLDADGTHFSAQGHELVAGLVPVPVHVG